MSLMKWMSQYLILILIVICGVGVFVYSPVRKEQPVVFVDVSPVSSTFSQVPRFTAPWMTSKEFAALHLDAYYQVIIDVNIFQPLQRRSSFKIDPYQLIGTFENDNEMVVYLLDTLTKKVHPVISGEKLGKFTVGNVTHKSVTLRDKNGVITKLELSSMFLR